MVSLTDSTATIATPTTTALVAVAAMPIVPVHAVAAAAAVPGFGVSTPRAESVAVQSTCAKGEVVAVKIAVGKVLVEGDVDEVAHGLHLLRMVVVLFGDLFPVLPPGIEGFVELFKLLSSRMVELVEKPLEGDLAQLELVVSVAALEDPRDEARRQLHLGAAS